MNNNCFLKHIKLWCIRGNLKTLLNDNSLKQICAVLTFCKHTSTYGKRLLNSLKAIENEISKQASQATVYFQSMCSWIEVGETHSCYILSKEPSDVFTRGDLNLKSMSGCTHHS